MSQKGLSVGAWICVVIGDLVVGEVMMRGRCAVLAAGAGARREMDIIVAGVTTAAVVILRNGSSVISWANKTHTQTGRKR